MTMDEYNVPKSGIDNAIHVFRTGRYDQAEKIFIRVIEKDPSNPIPWSYMGCINRIASRYREAFVCYNRALRLSPDHWPARLYRTLSCLSSDKNNIDTDDLSDFLTLVMQKFDIVGPSMTETIAEVTLTIFARDGHVPETFHILKNKNPILLLETIRRFDKFAPLAKFDLFFESIIESNFAVDCFSPLINANDISLPKIVGLMSDVYRMIASSSLCHLLELPDTRQTIDFLVEKIDKALLEGRQPTGVRIQLYQILNRFLSATPRMVFHDQGLKRALDDYGARNSWPSNIMSVGLMDLPNVVLKNWKIPNDLSAPDTKWVTLGSCFAENVAISINNIGKGKAFSLLIGELFNNTIFNYHLIKWIINGANDHISTFIDDNISEFWTISREYARQQLENADVIVITLGVSRARWWHQADVPALALGRTFRPPRDIKAHDDGKARRDHIVLRDISLEENIAYLERILDLLDIGKKKKIILSVSPVPLGAVRNPEENAIVADCLSKSCLRLCADRIVSKYSHVHYWPSFEIVKWLGAHVPYSTYSDSSHPERRLVEQILQTFLNSPPN